MIIERRDLKDLIVMREVLEYLRTGINIDIPIQQIIILFTVAEKPGITQSELAAVVGMSPSSISRSLRMMGRFLERGDDKEKGYGLIETRPDLRERHRQACFLTKAGDKVIEDVTAIIRKAREGRQGDERLSSSVNGRSES